MTVAATESTDKCFCVELFFLFVLLKEKKKNWVSRASNFMTWREVANKEEEKSWSEVAITKFAKSQSSQLLTNRLW